MRQGLQKVVSKYHFVKILSSDESPIIILSLPRDQPESEQLAVRLHDVVSVCFFVNKKEGVYLPNSLHANSPTHSIFRCIIMVVVVVIIISWHFLVD
jgi:hypothetical protein